MADDLEKQVTRNTIDIGILKNTSKDTLRGVNKIYEKLDGVDKMLRGKDSENPGLMTKVDRLENWSKRIKGILAFMGAAIVTMAGTVMSWALGLIGKGN